MKYYRDSCIPVFVTQDSVQANHMEHDMTRYHQVKTFSTELIIITLQEVLQASRNVFNVAYGLKKDLFAKL